MHLSCVLKLYECDILIKNGIILINASLERNNIEKGMERLFPASPRRGEMLTARRWFGVYSVVSRRQHTLVPRCGVWVLRHGDQSMLL